MVSVASYVLIIEGLGSLSALLQTGFSDRPYAFLFASVGMLLFLGLFLEPTVILLVFIPLLLPVARSLGLDDFHFAMVVMLTLTVGMITPPVGINLFVAMSIGNIRLYPLLKALWPFLVAELAVIALVIFVPPISTGLPGLLR